jgi:hypothetical protein
MAPTFFSTITTRRTAISASVAVPTANRRPCDPTNAEADEGLLICDGCAISSLYGPFAA